MIVPLAWQASAIEAFKALDGLMLAMSPGSGKTLVLARCLALGERPLLVCPAAARTQTRRMFDSYGVRSGFVSYSQISRDPDLLDRYKPDVIGLDESQALRRTRDSAWGRRISRYLAANPSCRVVASTGSIMHRSLVDYAHLLDWALRSRSPAPRSQAGIVRAALQAEADPATWLATLRACPGVYIDAAPSWDGELVIREHVLPVSDDSAYARAAATGLAPDGWACEGWALDELLRQLSWHGYVGRDPRPSERLVEVRRMWAKCVAEAKAYGLCDTELGARAHYPDAWRTYQAVLDHEPEGEPTQIWLDADAAVATVEGVLCQLGFKAHQSNTSGRVWESPIVEGAASGRALSAPSATAACGCERFACPRTASPTSCTTARSQTTCACCTAATTKPVSSPHICDSAHAQITPGTGTSASERLQASSTTPGSAGHHAGAPSAYSRTAILWVNHVALGELLSARLGVPYHHQRGLDAGGTSLDAARAPLIIASLAACHKAFNAQFYNTMVFLEPSGDARVMQQAIARCARQGQQSPCVETVLVVSSPKAAADLATSRQLAAEIELQTGQIQFITQKAVS